MTHHETRALFVAAVKGGCAICDLLWRHHRRSPLILSPGKGNNEWIRVGVAFVVWKFQDAYGDEQPQTPRFIACFGVGCGKTFTIV